MRFLGTIVFASSNTGHLKIFRRLLTPLLLAASVFLCTAGAASPKTAVPILQDEVLSRSHGAGVPIRYSFEARSGQAYLIEIAQSDLDLHISVQHADAPPTNINSPSFRNDRETVLLEPALNNIKYEIEIVSDEYTGAVGAHSICISKIDNPTAVIAHGYMSEAAAANRVGGNDNWKKSLSHYSAALSMWRDLVNKKEQARTLLNISNLQYWQFASWQEAADTAAAAAALYEEIGNSKLHAVATHLQATSLIEAALVSSKQSQPVPGEAQRMFQDALHLFNSALNIQVAHGYQFDEAETLNNIGLTYYYMDDWSKAKPYFRKAAEKFQRMDEWSGELKPVANLSVIDFELGRFEQAVDSLTRLLELIPADQEASWRAHTLDNLGASLLALGRVDEALKNFFEALALHEQVDNSKGQGRSLTGIGSTYYSIGELDLAREYLERALPIREQTNDGRGQVAVLHFLGDVYRQLGQYNLAIEYHDRALTLAVTPIARAKIEILKARDFIDVGNIPASTALLEQVVAVAQRTDSSAVAADALYELGRALARSGDAEQAQLRLQEARDSYEVIGSQEGQARSLLELARIRRDKDIDAAIAYAYEAITHVEKLRSRVASPELRAVYLSTRRDYFDFLIDSLMDARDAAVSAKGREDYLRQALSTAERARARATADLMNESAVNVRRGVDSELQARQRELYEKLAEKQHVRDQLLEGGAAKSEVENAVSELQDLNTALDVLEIELRKSNPRVAMITSADVLQAHEIQELLDEDSVLFEYWLGESSSYLWVVSRSDIQTVRVESRETIDGLATELYEALSGADLSSSSSRKTVATIRSLSEIIIGPVAGELEGKKRLIVAADGALQYIPFSLLSSDGQGKLVDSHEVVVVPSMTVLAAHRRSIANRSPAEKILAAVGDPVLTHSDPRLNGIHDVSPESSLTSSGGFLGLLGNRPALSRLPFSAVEIEAIGRLVPPPERLVATGLDATKEAIVQGAVADYRFVHLGTHGIINSRHPALSTLIFSLFDEAGHPVDGYLRLHDIYNLELDADLVVLSACETALGREINSEGTVGLTQGFMYAGSKGVIASLWRVSDRATAELMTAFYKYLLEDGDSPARALRRAQLDMVTKRRWRDPFFWSGFVLHGDWT